MNESLVPSVEEAGDFLIAFSTRSDGNMYRTNETRVAVQNNKLNFLRKLGVIPSDLFTIRTSHSPNVESVDRQPGLYLKKTYLQDACIETDFDHYYKGADGAITFADSLFVGLTSGDCVPVIIWDTVSGMRGILHVGLLGALNSMVKIVPRIFRDTGVALKDVRVYLGPSISQRNYNVSASGLWTAIADQAYAKIPAVREFIVSRAGAEYFDVPGMIVSQLVDAGLSAGQIQRYPHCIADPESMFFSHNVLKTIGERGSFMSIIGPRELNSVR